MTANTTEQYVALDVVTLEDGTHRVTLPQMRLRELQAENRSKEEAMKAYIAPHFPRWENVTAFEWALWGDADETPNWIYRNLMSVPLAAQAINIKVKDTLGDGILYVDPQAYAQGDTVPLFESEEEDFRERNRLETHYLPHAAQSLELFANRFTQFDRSRDQSKIDRIFHLDTPYSRLAKQSLKTWRIEYLLYSGLFGSGQFPTEVDIRKLPLYRWYDPDFFSWLRGESFAWHSYLPTPGMTYYARPLWLSLLQTGSWMDIARNVPRVVSSLQHRRAKISHQILISDTYMKLRWGMEKWESFSPEQKIAEYEKVAKKIEDMLTGVDNAGSVITNYAKDINGELVGAMEIKSIPDEFKSSDWIPDSAVANSEILNALGLHPSQMGLANEGGKMGSGSGSDARVHFNSGIYRNTLEQKNLLETLNFVCRFNGWKGRYIIKQSMAVQTNENKTGMVKNNQTASNPQ